VSKNRDRLDGTEKSSTIREIFLFPGRAFLWIQYMFPKAGYKNVRISSRHARSPLMTYFYSIIFWLGLIAVSFSHYLGL
jgi:hypothetical protein